MNKTIEERAKEIARYWQHRCHLAENVMEGIPDSYDAYKKFLAGAPIPETPIRNGIAALTQPTEAEGWTRVEDKLPEVGDPVEVITEYLSYGKPKSDRFIAYMDEYGDTIICPTDESYGWQFNDVVTHYRKLPAPPTVNK